MKGSDHDTRTNDEYRIAADHHRVDDAGIHDMSAYFYFLSLILFSIGYYHSLKGRGYVPFKLRHFYVMFGASIFIPIIGPIMAIITLIYLPNCGEQQDPAKKRRAKLVPTTFILIMIVIILVLIVWLQYKAMNNGRESHNLLVSARNYIRQADILKKEGKAYSNKIAPARRDLQLSRKIYINEYREAEIALISGDIFCLEGRYKEADNMYRNATIEISHDAQERLMRLNELDKQP
jgi:hypothetical protein